MQCLWLYWLVTNIGHLSPPYNDPIIMNTHFYINLTFEIFLSTLLTLRCTI
jgi:hypothetical protein